MEELSHLYVNNLGYLHSIFFENIIAGVYSEGFVVNLKLLKIKNAGRHLEDIFPEREDLINNIKSNNKMLFRENSE